MELSAGQAAAVIDFSRSKGIHAMPTPQEESKQLELATMIVNAAKSSWHNGAGNTGEAVTGVLKIAGIISGEEHEAGQVAETIGASGGVETGEEAGTGGGEAAGSGDDGDGSSLGGDDEEAPAPNQATEELGADPGGELPLETEVPYNPFAAGDDTSGEAAAEGGEGPDPDPEPEETPVEAPAGDVSEAGDPADGEDGEGVSGGGVPEHGTQTGGIANLPLRKNASTAATKALETISATRLPTPMDIMDGFEEKIQPLPVDITELSDVDLRRLYWQRHVLYVYARWMVARTEGQIRDVKFLLDQMDKAPNSQSPEDLEEELHEHTLVLGEMKASRDWFSSDVEALSREWTMRSKDSSGPGPFSK